jgi:hypothetical protein
LSFNGSLQRVRRAAFRSRTTPGVNGYIGGFGRIALAAAYWVGRQEELHALDVSGRSAITRVHVTATNPFCAGGHPDLVASAVIADRRARGMRAVKEIIARKRRIVTAGIAAAIMNGVVPIVIVIGVHAIPAAIVRL